MQDSEVVIAGIIVIIFLVIANLAIILLIVIRLFVIWLKATLSLVSLCSESCFRLTHLVELRIVVSIIFKDLILLILQVLILQLLDDLFLFRPALAILQVVHVQLVLQVIDVGVLLNVSSVETLQLSL